MEASDVIDLVKSLVPVALAYVALLRTRTELDILYAKGRGGPRSLRRRWYHVLKPGAVKAFEENHVNKEGG